MHGSGLPDCVRRFVDAINQRDLQALAGLMTEDHVFVDADGSEISGRERMSEAWRQYFGMMAAYTILVRETFGRGDTVVLVGSATGRWRSEDGTSASREWQVPAVWRAVVRDQRVAVWQLFVNPEPIRAARQ